MSYSFRVQAADKLSAKDAVFAKVDELVVSQAVHAHDRDAILANAYSAVDLLADNDTKDVAVAFNGYMVWSGAAGAEEFSVVSVCATASFAERAA